MKLLSNIGYGSTGQTLDVYLPDCESFPVMIYFHGGGLGLPKYEKFRDHDIVFCRRILSRRLHFANAVLPKLFS